MNIRAIERVYRRYAKIYDFAFGAIFQPGRKAIIELMNCNGGEHVLEVGVGTGLSLPLYPRNVFITGIDVSYEMLARANLRKTRDGLDNIIQLSLMDAQNMKFSDNSFDKVVAMYVASVVPDPERLVKEMRRVCKKNGQIVLVNHFNSKNPVLGSLERLIAPLSKQLGFRPDFSLDRFLDETGLVAADIYPVNIFNFCFMLEIKNIKNEITEDIDSAYVIPTRSNTSPGATYF